MAGKPISTPTPSLFVFVEAAGPQSWRVRETMNDLVAVQKSIDGALREMFAVIHDLAALAAQSPFAGHLAFALGTFPPGREPPSMKISDRRSGTHIEYIIYIAGL